MRMTIVTSVEELNALYGAPGEASLVKVTNFLLPEYRAMIEASPRGDAGAVIHIEDDRTLMLPDWRGNNRIDSLSNIVRDPRVALMFLIPGSNTTMRLNGRAVVRIDAALTERFVMDGKHPRSVVVISIEEVYSQCARAVLRADLWNPEKFRDTACLPTVGQMLASTKTGFDGASYDRDWPGRAAKTMW
jgi:PPOX class probable FMN-dependent enzyme